MFVELLNSGLFPVPLKSISVTLSICEFVAGVSATLNYENEEKVPLEAFFVFPMDEDSAVYSFETMVDGKKIMAELQDMMKFLGMSTLSPSFLFPSCILFRTSEMQLHKTADVECSFSTALKPLFSQNPLKGKINQRHSK